MWRAFAALAVAISAVVMAQEAGAAASEDYDAAVAALSSAAPLTAPPPNNPAIDFVVGGGKRGIERFGISAHSSATGADPFGHFEDTILLSGFAPFQYGAIVTCVAVSGNVAAVGVVATDTASNDFQGLELVIGVRDSGLPGGFGDGIQTVSIGDASVCALHLAQAAAVGALTEGNVLVNDAP